MHLPHLPTQNITMCVQIISESLKLAITVSMYLALYSPVCMHLSHLPTQISPHVIMLCKLQAKLPSYLRSTLICQCTLHANSANTHLDMGQVWQYIVQSAIDTSLLDSHCIHADTPLVKTLRNPLEVL